MTNGSDFVVAWRDEHLAGTLHLPDEAGPFPAVLMMQGSGPSDRDAEGYFAPIREAFLDRGLAVGSFDKPGCGSSTGDWRRHALRDRSDQALVVLDSLADHADIDAARLGVWGHSQGGWLTQLVAADRPSLHFAISNSGPSITVAQQDLYGCEHWMRSVGRTGDDIGRGLDFMGSLHDAARRGDTYDEVETTLLGPARGASWAEYVSINGPADWTMIATFVREPYDPIPTLGRVRCPYLAVFGGGDVLVPAWSGARETGEALTACPDATMVVFPFGDHRIQTGGDLEFAPGYLDLLADWAAGRAGLTPR